MTPGCRTRIPIGDDSTGMPSLSRSVVCADESLEVAGTAADGESALSAIDSLRPGLIQLDVEMPGAVANAGLAHHVLPLQAIVPEILRIAGRAGGAEARELLRSAV